MTEELRALARTALSSHDLCDHCLGRLVGKVGSGLTNETRGRKLRLLLLVASPMPAEAARFLRPVGGSCWVCGGLVERVPQFATLAARAMAEWEARTYLIGTKVDPEIINREETLWAETGTTWQEPIKSELNREIGKQVGLLTGLAADFTNPHLAEVVDTRYDHVTVDVAPLFVYGRYRKFSRELPQTRWLCRTCRGKGCPSCGGTGKMYPESVQELIAGPLQKATEAEDNFFHGMGREDIDARMLGNGRPFVLELRRPRRRIVDYEAATAAINEGAADRVEVEGLRPSDHAELVALKSAMPAKTYRVLARFSEPVPWAKLKEVVHALERKPIQQQTPARVAHRRADLVRTRPIHSIKVERLGDTLAALTIEAGAGTYVKEFVHGDEGRTTPNLAETLGVRCEILELDVIHIADRADQGEK